MAVKKKKPKVVVDKKKASVRGLASRNQAWKLQVSQFQKSAFAFEQNHEVQQDALKNMAPNLIEKWGLDLAKLTKASRAAFEQIGQMARDSGIDTSAKGSKL